jgi:transcriptional regulator with GAF, ATPase, and Fis domain
LRVLQDKVIERVGGAGPIKVDIRIIAATHRDLKTMIGEGGFREDLFFRLNVFPVPIPPLRERKDDIPELVRHFIRKKTSEMGLPGIPGLASGGIDALMAHGWPGNIRELENRVERALILNRGEWLNFPWPGDQGDLKGDVPAKDVETGSLNLDAFVSHHIRKVLAMTNGRVEGEKGAAKILGVHPRTLQHRMKKLNILFGRNYKKNPRA